MEKIASLAKNFTVIALGLIFGMAIVFGYHTVVETFLERAGLTEGSGAASAVAKASSLPPALVLPSSTAIGVPTELIIPGINVDAPVIAVGVNAEGNLGVPSDAVHAAWYKYGSRPGEPGAAVIDGHLDTKTAPEGVFYNLGKVRTGDEVDVRTDSGQMLVFRVTATAILPYDDPAPQLFTDSAGVPELNLITCGGEWIAAKKIYSERIVVFTQLVSQ